MTAADGPSASDLAEPGEIGVERGAVEDELCAAALAADLDQPRGLELFHMVRERGGADLMGFGERAAGRRLGRGAELFQDLHPARLGERARDALELPFGEGWGCGVHRF